MSQSLFRLLGALRGGPDQNMKKETSERAHPHSGENQAFGNWKQLDYIPHSLRQTTHWFSWNDASGVQWAGSWDILPWQKFWFWTLVTSGTLFLGCSGQFARLHQVLLSNEAQLYTVIPVTVSLSETRLLDYAGPRVSRRKCRLRSLVSFAPERSERRTRRLLGGGFLFMNPSFLFS